jgi:hypothetical protein
VVTVLLPHQSAQAKTVFSSKYIGIKQSQCKQQPKSKNAAFTSFSCGSAAGWRIWLEYEEGTTSLSLTRGGVRKNTGITEYTSGYVTTGDKIELRLKNGRLYSTVVRLIEYGSQDNVVTSELAVSNMAGDGCLVALIDAGPNQSAQARAAADKAASLPCL